MAPTQQLSQPPTRLRASHATANRRRPGHPPKPWVADGLAALAGVGLGVVIALTLGAESASALGAPGGWLTGAGRLFAMTGTYLLLVMIVLITRLPWLERTIGQDRLVRWHRRIAPWPIALISLHVVTITLGYAQAAKSGVLAEFWTFLRHYPDLLAATVAFALLVGVSLASVRVARHKMKYETWWAVHLYLYLALALAFAHQIATGVMFVGHPLARAFWIALWAGTAGLLVASRVVLPAVRNLRLQLRVVDVVKEAPGVFSLTLSGRRVDRLAVSGGQFFQWRFLAPGLWWHGHPYSLSAMPRPPFLRLTVKALGDHSSALARLRPGTRVIVEGPYGVFTRHARTTDRVTLVGAGVGMTPLRALLEDLPRSVEVAVVVRATSVADLVHRDEIRDLVELRRGQYHEVLGPRDRARFGSSTLRELVPDIAEGDVYICGPDGFSASVSRFVERLGVAGERVHVEAFSF